MVEEEVGAAHTLGDRYPHSCGELSPHVHCCPMAPVAAVWLHSPSFLLPTQTAECRCVVGGGGGVQGRRCGGLGAKYWRIDAQYSTFCGFVRLDDKRHIPFPGLYFSDTDPLQSRPHMRIFREDCFNPRFSHSNVFTASPSTTVTGVIFFSSCFHTPCGVPPDSWTPGKGLCGVDVRCCEKGGCIPMARKGGYVRSSHKPPADFF